MSIYVEKYQNGGVYTSLSMTAVVHLHSMKKSFAKVQIIQAVYLKVVPHFAKVMV